MSCSSRTAIPERGKQDWGLSECTLDSDARPSAICPWSAAEGHLQQRRRLHQTVFGQLGV